MTQRLSPGVKPKALEYYFILDQDSLPTQSHFLEGVLMPALLTTSFFRLPLQHLCKRRADFEPEVVVDIGNGTL
jgi:hypothetical protein